MIGWFPDIYPDELMYSYVVRYLDVMRYPSSRRNQVSFFIDLSEKNDPPLLVLHAAKEDLVIPIPNEFGLTKDDYVANHTLFPYHEPFRFAGDGTLARVRSGDIQLRPIPPVGLFSITHKDIAGFGHRYCPECATQDRQEYGEAFWHRSHNLPGSVICRKHERMLVCDWKPASHYPHQNQHWQTAEQVVPPGFAPQERADWGQKPSSRVKDILLRIAEQNEWLLDQKGLYFLMDETRNRYTAALIEKGYVRNGIVCGKPLVRDFKSFYSSPALDFLEYMSEPETNYPIAYIAAPSMIEKRYVRPEFHIATLLFLGHTLDSYPSMPRSERRLGVQIEGLAYCGSEHYYLPYREPQYTTPYGICPWYDQL
jgi:hypothetical protein